MVEKKFIYIFFVILTFIIHCKDTVILSGPMVGGVAMRSAKIFLQVDSSQEPVFASRDDTKLVLYGSKQSSSDGNSLFPSKRDYWGDFNEKTGVIHWELSDLEPGEEYNFKIMGREGRFKTKPLWKNRNKEAPDFKFLIASCHYVNEERFDRIGKPWGAEMEIFQAMEKEDSDFFLWMGDNTYLREADWDSPSGILHRYSHTRSLPESEKIFRTMPHFAIWDDHDFGPNDSSYAYSLGGEVESIFKSFWPDFNYPDQGIYRSFTWGDAEFFLLDNRTFRTSNKNTNNGKRTILGDIQIDWFFQAISDSTAKIKFVVMGGQFLNSAEVYENYANYKEERKYILTNLQKMNQKNIIFLTGDRHHSEISHLSEGGNDFYEFTVSPLTAGIPSSPIQEKNKYRVEGSLFQERLYGLVKIEGNQKERRVSVEFKNHLGKLVYTYTIPVASW